MGMRLPNQVENDEASSEQIGDSEFYSREFHVLVKNTYFNELLGAAAEADDMLPSVM